MGLGFDFSQASSRLPMSLGFIAVAIVAFVATIPAIAQPIQAPGSPLASAAPSDLPTRSPNFFTDCQALPTKFCAGCRSHKGPVGPYICSCNPGVDKDGKCVKQAFCGCMPN